MFKQEGVEAGDKPGIRLVKEKGEKEGDGAERVCGEDVGDEDERVEKDGDELGEELGA